MIIPLSLNMGYKFVDYALIVGYLVFHPTYKYSPQHPNLLYPQAMFILYYQTFTPIPEHRQDCSFVYSKCFMCSQLVRIRTVLKWMVPRTTYGQFALNFLMNQTWISYCWPQISELFMPHFERICLNTFYKPHNFCGIPNSVTILCSIFFLAES